MLPRAVRVGDKVKFASMAGPCLPATVVRINRDTYTLNFYGTKKLKSKSLVHNAPCSFCPESGYTYDN